MTKEILAVRDISTSFPSPRGVVQALDSVSFTLGEGETIGIVGESGSGKSMLARSVMGLLPPTAVTSGEVVFDGRELSGMRVAERRAIWGKDIAMVFQDPGVALNPTIRVGAQIGESLRLHLGMRRREARARAVDLLGHVGIPEPARRYESFPHELSGGMRQRVCIAVAIACSPRILIADEPTTALDVTIQRQILDLLASLQAEFGMSMLLISHDLGVVARRAKRIVVMYGGRIVESGSTATIFKDTRHPYTEGLLGSIPRLDLPRDAPLRPIPGRPLDVIAAGDGCRFAPRCIYARPTCLTTNPPPQHDPEEKHMVACFNPLGSDASRAALDANTLAGATAAGLVVDRERDPHGW